jgi:hypothetical protein
MTDTSPGPPEDPGWNKRRNPWVWISLVLALVAAGLLIWALNTQSDLDSAEQDADELQAQVARGKQTGSAVLEQGKAAYDDLSQQLGVTTEDLEATDQDLEDAQKKAGQAEQDAAAGERKAAEADNEADKAQAATDKAEAEAEAADPRAAIAADCAKAYVSALGVLFEGESVSAQAEVVKQQLGGISATCKAALEGLRRRRQCDRPAHPADPQGRDHGAYRQPRRVLRRACTASVGPSRTRSPMTPARPLLSHTGDRLRQATTVGPPQDFAAKLRS